MTMDHRSVILKGLAEKYFLGELDERDQSEFEAHFFECPECAEDIEAMYAFEANAKAVLAAEPNADAKPERQRSTQPFGRLWPVPVGLAAALIACLSVVVYQNLTLLPELRQELATADSIQPASMHFLPVTRGEPPEVAVGADQRMVALTLSMSDGQSFPYYRADVRDADGHVVQTGVIKGPPPGEEIHLLLPVRNLERGLHVIRLQGLDAPDSSTPTILPAKYRFFLQIDNRPTKEEE